MLGDIDEGRIAAVAQATADAEIWNTPLLALLETAFATEAPADDAELAPAARFVSTEVGSVLRQPRERYWTDPPPERLRRRYVELRNRIVRELYLAEGKLMAGSGDPQWLPPYGFGLYVELEHLVAAGLPPYAALRAATRSPADFLSWRGGGRTEYATVDEGAIRFESAFTGEVDFGSVAVGKRADLVLLGASPLDDIGNIRKVEGVVLRGRWLSRRELDDLLARSAEELSRAAVIRP
jgi:imidazolonepropionase-like amidohydrolase